MMCRYTYRTNNLPPARQSGLARAWDGELAWMGYGYFLRWYFSFTSLQFRKHMLYPQSPWFTKSIKMHLLTYCLGIFFPAGYPWYVSYWVLRSRILGSNTKTKQLIKLGTDSLDNGVWELGEHQISPRCSTFSPFSVFEAIKNLK